MPASAPSSLAFELDLDAYGGPFDLLLALVLRDGIELVDVPMADICVAYLERLAADDELDLEAASEFLVLVAALCELKARGLMPGEDEAEEPLDPELAAAELAGRLAEYARVQAGAAWLAGRRAEVGQLLFRSGPPALRPPRPVRPEPVASGDPATLRDALAALLEPPPPVSLAHLPRRNLPVRRFLQRPAAAARRARHVHLRGGGRPSRPRGAGGRVLGAAGAVPARRGAGRADGGVRHHPRRPHGQRHGSRPAAGRGRGRRGARAHDGRRGGRRVKVDVAARCSVLAAASMASTHVATAIRAWRTVRPGDGDAHGVGGVGPHRLGLAPACAGGALSELTYTVEALLFVASGPLTVDELAAAAEAPPERVERAIDALAERHSEGRSGVVLERVSGGYALRAAASCATACARLLDRDVDRPLSQAALETLAIVAYAGPVSRPEIARIRGVAADAAVASLQERGLIEEAGRATTPGSAVLYRTTTLFDRIFGLADGRASLPPIEELSAACGIARRPARPPRRRRRPDATCRRTPPRVGCDQCARSPSPAPCSPPWSSRRRPRWPRSRCRRSCGSSSTCASAPSRRPP